MKLSFEVHDPNELLPIRNVDVLIILNSSRELIGQLESGNVWRSEMVDDIDNRGEHRGYLFTEDIYCWAYLDDRVYRGSL